MTDPDRILIESTRTHRGRLVSAFVHGPQERRRQVNNGGKRILGSSILAAVIGIGCLGTSWVLDILDRQRNETAITSFTEALAANPMRPTDDMPEDEDTGFLIDLSTGTLVDPRTGFPVDPDTGLVVDPDGRFIDPRISWYLDPETGYYTDPASGVTIDPTTLRVVTEED